MSVFTVSRTINGKPFIKDKDRIIAGTWEQAELQLNKGIASGKYDYTCTIDGILIDEIPVSDDFVLDIIIANR